MKPGEVQKAREMALWQHACSWLRAGEARDLIVTVGGALMTKAWGLLHELARWASCRVWVVVAHLPGHQPPELRSADVVRCSPAAFEQHWRRRVDTEPATRTEQPLLASYPKVPDADFISFHTATQRLLSPENVVRVTADYYRSMQRATDWTVSNQVSEETVAGYIRTALCDCQITDQALVVLRGMQAAFFDCGYLVRVRVEMFAAMRPRDRSKQQRAAGPLLGRWPTTLAPAIATVALASDRSAPEIAVMTVSDIADDGAISIAGGRFEPEEGLQQFTLAQRFVRELQGAANSDPLFCFDGKNQIGVRTVRRMLHHVVAVTGLRLIPPQMDELNPTNIDWMRRRGVSVLRIA